MKRKNLLTIVLISVMGILLSSCGNHESAGTNTETQINVSGTDVLAGANFDLQALGEIIKKCETPESIETEINKEGGINNLDLDENGEVDFIKVTEYGELPNLGYSFTACLEDGEPEIATIEINQTSSEVTISGNESYYGEGSHYQSHYSTGDYLLMAYLFSPRYSPYYSPYRYGYYGSYYRPYVSVGYGSYSQRGVVSTSHTSKTYTKTTTKPKSSITSPNKKNVSKKASATAAKKKASVANSKSSKKSFDTKKKSSNSKSGGFGNKKKSTSSKSNNKSSTSRSSSRSRSSGRSGGGRRSDVNVKQDIVHINYGLQTILALQAVSYSYTPEYIEKEQLPATPQIGLIAQDVEKLVPEVVTTDESGLKSIDYDLLVPVLIEAMKEQQKQIDLLESDIKSLTNAETSSKGMKAHSVTQKNHVVKKSINN